MSQAAIFINGRLCVTVQAWEEDEYTLFQSPYGYSVFNLIRLEAVRSNITLLGDSYYVQIG